MSRPGLHVRRILVPVDFSDHALNAVRVSEEIARRYRAKIFLLHVLVPLQFGVYMPHPRSDEEILRQASQEAERQMRAFLKKIRESGRRWTILYESGPASVRILEVAEKRKMDLIVIGSLGRTNLVDYLMGSTAENVVRRSKVSVLVVRP
ncbi:MAG: universal stress protein [Nitrospirae bacterium]|nr:universal stress protein [Nitrospirota bacterium]